jgi:hypothetical protein
MSLTIDETGVETFVGQGVAPSPAPPSQPVLALDQPRVQISVLIVPGGHSGGV